MKMKKILIYSLSVMMVAGAAISCKKTSKGKMSNEWQLDSWSETTTTIQDNGDKNITTRDASGSTYIIKETSTPNGGATTTTTTNGTLDDFSLTIEKDGTWSRDFSYTITYSNTQNGFDTDYVEEVQTSESGTWNFLGNVDEFKKNERVVFNTLSSTEISTITSTYEDFQGDTQTNTTTDTDTYSFNDGDIANIMVVIESKRKELKMESDEKMVLNESTDSDPTETYTRSVMTEISLTQE